MVPDLLGGSGDQRRSFSLLELVHEVVASLAPALETHQVRCELDAAEGDQRGVVDSHSRGFDEARIGRHPFSFFQDEDIAGHNLAPTNFDGLSVSRDPGFVR